MSETIPTKESSRTCAIDSCFPSNLGQMKCILQICFELFYFDDILAAQFPVKLEPCSAKLKNKGPLIVLKFENILQNMKLSFPCRRNTLTD